ncbi:MAG: RNA-binding protein [Magnetococcales bacterium]|nr:RNA-binding protein [Magnetococcales bacterium]
MFPVNRLLCLTNIRGVCPLKKGGENVGKVFVGNLPFEATEVDLHDFFSTDMEVGVVKVVRDRETGQSRGFAFVDVDDPELMVSLFNGRDLEGRLLKVDLARERPDRSHGLNKGAGARLFRRTR